MPELPEVETVMRGMRAHLEGHTIVHAEMRRRDLRWAMPAELAERLRGARVLGFRRRGKYILMRLDGGFSMLLHLGMSGRVKLSQMDAAAAVVATPHEHLVIETEQGWRFGLVDPRRFGSVHLLPTDKEDEHRLLAGLGPEPLDAGLDADHAAGYAAGHLAQHLAQHLAKAFRGRGGSLKAALLDQRVIAGLGNIYVCEALFRAGLSPCRAAGTLGAADAARLAAAIRAVLGEAIAAGGSSLRDYVQPDGELGYFQHAWRVYGRQGQACPDCPGTPACAGIARIVQSGRSSFYCPRLQR